MVQHYQIILNIFLSFFHLLTTENSGRLLPQNEIDNQPWEYFCWRVVPSVLHIAFEKRTIFLVLHYIYTYIYIYIYILYIHIIYILYTLYIYIHIIYKYIYICIHAYSGWKTSPRCRWNDAAVRGSIPKIWLNMSGLRKKMENSMYVVLMYIYIYINDCIIYAYIYIYIICMYLGKL